MDKLTQARLKELLHYDPLTGIFTRKISTNNRFKVGDIAGYKNKQGYIIIRIDGKGYRAHRLAWCYIEGYFPEHHVDHINRNPSDNRFSNLRHVTNQCNLRNTGNFKHNNSGVKGICWNKDKNKWLAQIKINGKIKYLGRYSDFTEAVFHRYEAEICLNWPGCDSNSPARQWLLKQGYINVGRY